MITVRNPAVADIFYTGNKDRLLKMINGFLDEAPVYPYRPMILVCPHAGYIYSGKTAGVSYKQLYNLNRDDHHTFLLIGPSHYVYTNSVSFGYHDFWETPLGKVKVNKEKIETFFENNGKHPYDLNTVPHLQEHSLEVQIPFLQVIMKSFDIIPVVYGDVDYLFVKKIIEHFIDENTVVIISSDLSHYYPDEYARKLDSYCHLAVERLDSDYLLKCEACGKIGIRASIEYAKGRGLKGKLLDYKTSGDTSGDYGRVVGYGSYIFYK